MRTSEASPWLRGCRCYIRAGSAEGGHQYFLGREQAEHGRIPCIISRVVPLLSCCLLRKRQQLAGIDQRLDCTARTVFIFKEQTAEQGNSAPRLKGKLPACRAGLHPPRSPANFSAYVAALFALNPRAVSWLKSLQAQGGSRLSASRKSTTPW